MAHVQRRQVSPHAGKLGRVGIGKSVRARGQISSIGWQMHLLWFLVRFGERAMEYILLVTWFSGGQQQPNSYQVGFGTQGACVQAAMDLRKEETRLNDQTMTPRQPVPQSTATPGAPTTVFTPQRGPMLSAVCVVKK
jgi:hypothetical protein